MAEEIRTTYCRICEALCGLRVTVEGGNLVKAVRPDPDHPLSRGYACAKGLAVGGLHHDPDRLDRPLKRVGDRWEPIGWDQAMAEIARKILDIRRRHGRHSLGMYFGNPSAFSYKHFFFANQFLSAVGSPNVFSSSSIDCNNKFEVSRLMYGLPAIQPIPHLSAVRFLLVMGSNPAVSQMSFIHAPNALEQLRRIERRGGKVVIVDPRRTETAERVGEHHFIRPGADAFLLGTLLHIVFRDGREKAEAIRAYSEGIEALRASVDPWTPERAERLTGIPVPTIERIAREFCESDGAAAYLSTGVNMGPFGSVAYWWLQALNFVTGNLDREGGLIVPHGPVDLIRLSAGIGFGMGSRRSRVGGWKSVVGAFPASLLADEIETEGEGQVRALLVSAGNPVHSVPGDRLERAFQQLELLVVVDLYRSETGRLAHYLLPAQDFLEHSDYPLPTALTQETAFAQFTEAVVPPTGERREEWEIFSELALALGVPFFGRTPLNGIPHINRWLGRLFPGRGWRLTPDRCLDWGFRLEHRVRLRQLKAQPSGMFFDGGTPGSFLGRRVYRPAKRIDLAPAPLLADLPRLQDHERRMLAAPPDTLRLIGRRERKSHNSWMHNNPGLRQPAANTAWIHPDDAAARGIADGDRIEIRIGEAFVRLPAQLADSVAPGVICVPHGWEHDSEGLSQASRLGGANVNRVIPGGAAHTEPVSGQAIMVGHTVTVTRVDPERAKIVECVVAVR